MQYGKTDMVLCKDEMELGKQAACDVATKIRELLAEREEIRIIFAAGESQMTFLDALATEKNIDWQRIVCLNMDDFYHTEMPEEFTCGYQTKRQLYDKVNPKRVHLVKFNAPDPEAEARRFEAVMREEGEMDILCQGIGTSGHLALNEPFETVFNDQAWVRVVNISKQSETQLKEDPNFKALGFIPSKGITMTIPGLFTAKHIYTMVPLGLKRPILEKVFAANTPTTDLPSTILLETEGTLYMDRNSCPENLLHLN
jgi:glucosamine-6-phosphate deaminase